MSNENNAEATVPSRVAPFDVEVTNQLHSLNFNTMQVFHRAATTNILLTVIALLMLAVVVLLYQQRPITRHQLADAITEKNDDRYEALLERVPLVRIANPTLDVNVENYTLDVEVVNPTLSVEIER